MNRLCFRLFDLIKKYSLLVLAISLFGLQSSFAQSYAEGSDVGVNAEKLFVACAFCHGPEGQGGPAVDAPPLAGMEAWYVEKQLLAFANRTRGMHADDVPGLQMSIVSGMTRNMATIKNIADYVSKMDTDTQPELYYGEPITNKNRNWVWESEYAVLDHPERSDAEKGEEIYVATCLSCHGANGEGNEALGAPKLTLLPDWYMRRQLQYFKNGIRGIDPSDINGQQMAVFTKMLADNQAIADVTAYSLTLGGLNDE